MSKPLYYTVWTTRDERVVAFGTVSHCAQMLGIDSRNFYTLISHINTGQNKKYEYYAEPLYLEEYIGEPGWDEKYLKKYTKAIIREECQEE